MVDLSRGGEGKKTRSIYCRVGVEKVLAYFIFNSNISSFHILLFVYNSCCSNVQFPHAGLNKAKISSSSPSAFDLAQRFAGSPPQRNSADTTEKLCTFYFAPLLAE